MIRRLLFTVALASALVAQSPESKLTIAPGEPYPNAFDKLKVYLNLTDGQAQSLTSNLADKNRADQAVWEQVGQKQRALYELLGSGSTDALRIGQLMIEIHQLQKQPPTATEPYKTRALNVLNPEQKAKLPTLSNALELAPTSYQAAGLLLIDNPTDDVRILPALAIEPIGTVAPARLGGRFIGGR